MTIYFESFASMTVGAAPTGWTAQWSTTTAWTIQAGGADNVVQAAVSASGRAGLSWNALDADVNRDNIELVGRFQWSGALSSTATGIFMCRGSGAAGADTQYKASLYSGNGFKIDKEVAGTGTNLAADMTVTLTAGTWYRARFRVNGTTLQAKLWLDTSAEPAAWTMTVTDTSISAAGFNGFHTAYVSTTMLWDWIGAGTNGDTAPMSGATIMTLSTPAFLFTPQALAFKASVIAFLSAASFLFTPLPVTIPGANPFIPGIAYPHLSPTPSRIFWCLSLCVIIGVLSLL